jgi:hypothetical protein
MGCITDDQSLLASRDLATEPWERIHCPHHELLWDQVLSDRFGNVGPIFIALTNERHELFLICQQRTPPDPVSLRNCALSAHKHLIPFGILWRRDEGSGFGRDADGSRAVGGRGAYLGLWHARGDGQEARIGRIRRADILANTGVDPIGPNQKISPVSASASKLKADIIIAFPGPSRISSHHEQRYVSPATSPEAHQSTPVDIF